MEIQLYLQTTAGSVMILSLFTTRAAWLAFNYLSPTDLEDKLFRLGAIWQDRGYHLSVCQSSACLDNEAKHTDYGQNWSYQDVKGSMDYPQEDWPLELGIGWRNAWYSITRNFDVLKKELGQAGLHLWFQRQWDWREYRLYAKISFCLSNKFYRETMSTTRYRKLSF